MSRRPLLLLVAAGLAGTAAAADWPQWRGPNRDGKSADTGLLREWPAGGPSLLWQLPDVGAGYGTPAVVGDKLYLIGSDGKKAGAKEFVLCLAAADGKEVWRHPIDTAEVKFNDGWGGGPRATPTVVGGFVYALGASGDLVCLTADTGSPVWAKNFVQDFGGKVPTWGYSESPLVDAGKVVVTPGAKGGMVALDGKTGDTLWQCKELKDAAGYSSVVVAEVGGVRQYVQQTMAHGIGVRAADGKLLWTVGEIGRRVAVIPTPVVAGDLVFFTAGYGAGCEAYKLVPAGDGTKAEKLYSKNKVVSNHHGGMIAIDGKVYGHSDTGGQWVCFDLAAGGTDPVWGSKKLGKGSVSYADGYLYCYGEDKGELVRVKVSADGWEEAGRFKIPATSKLRVGTDGKVWPHPVISNGRLYLRDYERLYCYDLRGPQA